MRVLVVDDEEDVRALLRIQLTRAGHEVVAEAADGDVAIDEAERHKPDVIVLDLMMPTLPGELALPGLRAAAPNARVVVYSAATYRDSESLIRSGAAGVVEKGDLRHLLALIDQGGGVWSR